MNHTELLELKKETELKLQEIELKIQETATSFVDVDTTIELDPCGYDTHLKIKELDPLNSRFIYVSKDNIPKLINILNNFVNL